MSALPPRRRAGSLASCTSTSSDHQEDADKGGEDGDEEGLQSKGVSIRLITRSDGDEEGVGEVSSSSSSRTILGETSINDSAVAQPPASSSMRSIYPWKRITSSSIPQVIRSASNFTLSSRTGAAREDDPMTLDEFGVEQEKESAGVSQRGSLSSLKRWLSKPSATTTLTSQPPVEASVLASQTPKRKREEDEEDRRPNAMQASPERPVRRAIKGRPSRSVASRAANTNATTSAKEMAAVLSPTHTQPANDRSTASITHDDLSEAAARVLEEVNARLAQSGKASMVQLSSQSPWSLATGVKPPPSPLKSVHSRTKGRFSNEHDKHFGRMDSIASHYAAKRERESSSVKGTSGNEAKRVKIAQAEPSVRSAEDRAAVLRKLELTRQRRKSVGRKTTAVSGSKGGLKGKITGVVRGFARAVAGGDSRTGVAEAPSPRKEEHATPPAPAVPTTHTAKRQPSSSVLTKTAAARPKAAFDLHASLARKPTGYRPYSAKETVQMLQAGCSLAASPSKAIREAAASPIRTDSNVGPSPTSQPNGRVPSASSTIAFPTISPRKGSLPHNQVQIHTAPVQPTMAGPPSPALCRRTRLSAPAKKTRSSMSSTQRGTMQTHQLKRAARANEIKHQASMAARKRTGEALERAVQRGRDMAANAAPLFAGEGRGSPRKTSGRQVMQGEGRGAMGVKRSRG